MPQAKFINQLIGFALLFRLREFGELQHTFDIVLNAQLSKYRSLLCQIANTALGTFVHRVIGNIGII